MADPQWHYATEDGTKGPVSTAQLLGLMRSAQVPQDVLVWQEGWPAWRSAREIPELEPTLQRPPRPPVAAAAPPRRKAGRVLLAGAMLLLLATAALALLLWVDPAWLDERASWRGPRLPRDVVLTADAASREALLASLPEPAVSVPPAVATFEEAAASAMVTPSEPTRLTTGDGAVLDMPAGAIVERAALTLAPVVGLPQAMAGPVTGPAVQVRIAGRGPTPFARPAVLHLPYRPEMFREGAPVVGVFEAGHWRPLPSRVDAQRHLVSADVSTASVLAVLNEALPAPVAGVLVHGTALAAAGYVLSSGERERLFLGIYEAAGCAATVERTGFVVHACTSGAQAAEPGLADEIARQLEAAAVSLGSLSMKPDPPATGRHHVFLAHLPGHGATPLGGPLFVDARLRARAAEDGLAPDDVVRATVVHEMVHLAQARSFSALAQERFAWWLEASATYLSDLYWDREGRPVDMAPNRWARVATGPLCLDGPDRHPAGGASFLRWLDTRKPGAGLAFTQAVNSRGEATLRVLDAVARESLGQGLPALFARFAVEFHHDDLWAGGMAPRLHRGPAPLAAAIAHTAGGSAREFAAVVAPRGGTGVMTPSASSTSSPLPPLCAAAFSMNTGPLDRRGRLVVRHSPAAVEAWLGAGRLGTEVLPGSGTSGSARRLTEPAAVVDGVGGTGLDQVTLVLVNPSLETEAAAVTADRWLLLPPEAVRATRDGTGTWTITWSRVALADPASVFAGTTLYRRRPSAPDSAWTAVQADITETSATDRPPDGGDWVYAVRVVDVLGNESEAAGARDADPFGGTWSGSLRVVGGNARAAWDDLLAAALEPADQARIPGVMAWTARLGIPVGIRLEAQDGGVVMRATRVGPWPVSGRAVALDVLGPRTLAPRAWTGRGVRPLFRITREGEVREDGFVAGAGTLAWNLHRERP